MKYPNLFTVEDLIQNGTQNQAEVEKNRWVPARPLALTSIWNRFKYAWLVFTGRADAVVWTKQ